MMIGFTEDCNGELCVAAIIVKHEMKIVCIDYLTADTARFYAGMLVECANKLDERRGVK